MCINHDPMMTLTYFTTKSMHLNGGKLLKCGLKGKTCRKWATELKIRDSEKNGPQGLVCSYTGAIYMYNTKMFKDQL